MAAGKGTRMQSAIPKVLHKLGGKPMLQHVLETATSMKAHCNLQRIITITGHMAEQVEVATTSIAKNISQSSNDNAHATPIDWISVRQNPQLGTGHAVQQTLSHLPDTGLVLVLSGDVPLTTVNALQKMLALSVAPGLKNQTDTPQRLVLLTLDATQPTDYGRIVRNEQNQIVGIVEQKDATPAQLNINEIYSGIMLAPAKWLKKWVAQLTNNNAQQEYYLTDTVAMAVQDGMAVAGHTLQQTDSAEVAGINSPLQLVELERVHQLRLAHALLEKGTRLADLNRIDIRGSLVCGKDVEIDVNCVFSGNVILGDGVKIGANCCIQNANIGKFTTVQPFTHIDGGENDGTVLVGEDANIGPFARLRPHARLGNQVHIGNFVEIKNSNLQTGAKANHLAYLGDADVGEWVNFGAGSITANYDGTNKHRTNIENDVHIGSNCVLVAPLVIGRGGTVGGGSTLTKNTPAYALTVARSKPISIANWQRPAKIKKD